MKDVLVALDSQGITHLPESIGEYQDDYHFVGSFSATDAFELDSLEADFLSCRTWVEDVLSPRLGESSNSQRASVSIWICYPFRTILATDPCQLDSLQKNFITCGTEQAPVVNKLQPAGDSIRPDFIFAIGFRGCYMLERIDATKSHDNMAVLLLQVD